MSQLSFLAYTCSGMQDIGRQHNQRQRLCRFHPACRFQRHNRRSIHGLLRAERETRQPLGSNRVGGLSTASTGGHGRQSHYAMIAGVDVFPFGLGASFYGHIVFRHALAFLVILRDMAVSK